MVYLKLGFRNLFRNKKRSYLAALVVGIGLSAMIIMDGFIEGMLVNMVKMTTSSLIGQGQIHNKDFKENFETEKVIKSWPELKTKIESSELIKSYSRRVMAMGMLASPRNSRNIMVYGVNPSEERSVTNLEKYLVEGNFLANEMGLVIGKELAKKLEVSLGEKVILTVAETNTGELSQEVFRVSGLIGFGSKEMDEGMAFISFKTAQRVLALKEDFHEVVLNFESTEVSGDQDMALWKNLSFDDNLAESWKDLAPGITGMIDMMSSSTLITASLLGFLVALGIINTLFMSILERLFEFGVLRAIGTNSLGVVAMIVSESLALGLLSVVLGGLITLVLGGYMAMVGVDYGGIEFNSMTFREPIYYLFDISHLTIFPLFLLIFVMVVSLYPAIYAARITLAQAMRKSL